MKNGLCFIFIMFLVFVTSCSFVYDLTPTQSPPEVKTDEPAIDEPPEVPPEEDLKTDAADVPAPVEPSGPTPDAEETEEPDIIEEILAGMTVREKIGQLIVSRIPDDYRRYIDDYHVGGFILFKEDVNSKEQLHGLIKDLRGAAAGEIPLLLSVDEEGGRVSRLGHLYGDTIPPMLEVGQTGDTENAYNTALKISERLAEFGIDMDFAPVADIWTNPKNTVIGDRAFAEDAETAAAMVEAAVRGLRDAGILSVVKHFPGHGDTAQDSHVQIAQYQYGRERFDTAEALPFISGIKAGVDGVMVGHISTPEMRNEKPVLEWMNPWFETGSLPATFSDYWMKDVLRDEMGFEGLIITDGLEMGALTNNFTPGQIALGAFMAGADILLIPPSVPAAVEALELAYDEGIITDERLDASVRRVLRVKLKE